MSKRLISPVLLFAIGAFLANIPLFLGGKLYGSEDLLAYYQWAREFGEAIQQGFIRPRWDPSGMDGLGAPSLIYYPPAFFYATSLLELAGADTWTAMRIVVLSAWWALGWLFWRFLSRHVSNGWAIAGGLAMQWNPFLYHAISLQNLFPFAVTALPLTWLILASMNQKPGRFSIQVALSLALLVVTHQLVAFMALISLPAFFFPGLIRREPGAWSRMIAWGLSCVTGLLLSGWHLFTAMTTMDLIQTDDWFEPFHCDWRNSFITPVVTWGIYGMRWAGIQWGIGGVALFMLAASIMLLRDQNSSGIPRSTVAGWNLCWAGMAGFFFASEGSYLIWQHAPLIDMVQWPYRFLAVLIPVLVTALVLAGAKSSASWRKAIALLMLAMLPAMNLALQLRNYSTLTVPDFDSLKTLKYYSRPADLGPEWKLYINKGGLAGECARKDVIMVESQPRSQVFAWRFQTMLDTDLSLPVMAYPAWSVKVNDQSVERTHDPSTGLIVVPLPKGSAEVTLAWQILPQERIGQAMSLTGLVIIGAMIVWSFRRKSAYAVGL